MEQDFLGRPPPARVVGFTLIEMLLVIGILAMLMALLLPSLGRARQQAQATVCASNLRQIAMGWNLYAQQYRDVIVAGRFPPLPETPENPRANIYFVGNGWKYRARWYAVLGAQVRLYAFSQPSERAEDDNTQPVDGAVFLDPAVPERNNGRNYPFGYNYQFLGNSRLKVNSADQHDWINWPVRIDRIRATSSTVMAADCLGTAASTPASERLPYDPTGTRSDPRAIGNHAWGLDPPRLTADSDYCDDKYRGEARSALDPRHLGRANVVFCDGHVERLLPEQLGYVTRPDGTTPLIEEGNNRFFSGTGRDDDPPAVSN